MASNKKSQVKGKGSRLRKDVEAEQHEVPTKPKKVKTQLKPGKHKLGTKKANDTPRNCEAAGVTEGNEGAKGTADRRGKILKPDAAGGASVGKRQRRDPFEVAKRKMQGSVPAIVDAMVELAKQGSCQHAKTLLEMSGAKHMFEEAENEGTGESWAKLVLDRLDETESGSEQGNTRG